MRRPFWKRTPLEPTAALARSITWVGSKQTYATIQWLVDEDLRDDCFRAYAYFRWADDIIDSPSRSMPAGISFIRRQKALIQRIYRGELPHDLSVEEQMIADLIHHDRGGNSKLKSFIFKFLAILEFDAHRRGRAINQEELTWYSSCLAKAVTDGIQYFIGHGHPYPQTENRYHAVFAAHITHMLRDLRADLDDGYINIPLEKQLSQGVGIDPSGNPALQSWVRERVELARKFLREGKQYLYSLGIVRSKLAGLWYCSRYEWILDAIQQDSYRLRASYKPPISAWLTMAWLGVKVPVKHFVGRTFLDQDDGVPLHTQRPLQKKPVMRKPMQGRK